MRLSTRRVSAFMLYLALFGIVGFQMAVGLADPLDTKPVEKPVVPEKTLSETKQIVWQEGPTTAKIGNVAEIDVPTGFRLTGPDGARTFLESKGNLPDVNVAAILVPVSDNKDWTLVFMFDEIGYVKDDDRNALDADRLIRKFREGIQAENELRSKREFEELLAMHWAEEPFYDPDTNYLNWALLLSFPSGPSVNYDIRLLGRYGVMRTTMVDKPESYSRSISTVKKLLKNFRFTPGQRYDEWTEGDKMAGYGLAGLVTGGAAVGAMKAGLLSKVGLIVSKGGKAFIIAGCVLVAGLFSFFKKMMRR